MFVRNRSPRRTPVLPARPTDYALIKGREMRARGLARAILGSTPAAPVPVEPTPAAPSADQLRPDLLRLTLQAASDRYSHGAMSQRDWRYYMLCWLWTAERFGGWQGQRHERAYARLGSELYQRRIARARRRCGFPPDRGLTH